MFVHFCIPSLIKEDILCINSHIIFIDKRSGDSFCKAIAEKSNINTSCETCSLSIDELLLIPKVSESNVFMKAKCLSINLELSTKTIPSSRLLGISITDFSKALPIV